LAHLAERLGNENLADCRVVLHYLDGKVDAEIYVNRQQSQQAGALQERCDALIRDDEFFRIVQIHLSHTQS
jgi:hypothetical protein